MSRILVIFFSLFIGTSLTLMAFDAEARRMGGGKSFGMQRSAPAQRQAAPQQQNTSPAATPQKRSWMGPIAGLAAGLGLAALMSHLGLGEEFANILLIALAIMAAWIAFRYFTRNNNAPARLNYANAHPNPIKAPTQFDLRGMDAYTPASATSHLPAGFDVEAFVREAKINFIRLQAANDAGNVEDLRAFTTPELFAELRMQLAERGGAKSVTDVVKLNAEVLECAEENDQLIASVRFDGLIKEDNAVAEPFDETWHLTKPASGAGGWLVAGIQQNDFRNQ